MKDFTPSPQVRAVLEQMSRDMAVPVEGLVNQAVFTWAKLHGYVTPSEVEAPVITAPSTQTHAAVMVPVEPAPPPAPPPVVPPVTPVETKRRAKAPPEEPETARVPVVDEPTDSEWKIVSRGSFAPSAEEPLESTIPQMKRVQRLVLIVGDREVPVDSDRFLIGRDVSCNLTIDAPRVSRQHAVIHVGLLGAELQDLGSSNGTWFEGERIERRKLQHGDLIHFGDSPVRVVLR